MLAQPVLVAAGNYRQFRDWCWQNKVRERTEAVYIRDEYTLCGFRWPPYVTTGTYWLRRDWPAIIRALEQMGAVCVC